MDKKTLHVVYGPSFGGSVRYGLWKLKGISEEIVYPNFNFSFGYIPKNFSDRELCYALLAAHGRIELFDNLKAFINKDFSLYDRVIVWHGWSSADLFLLYLMSVIVENNLYHVDIMDSKGFMEKHLSTYPSILYPDVGYVSAYDVYEYDMVSLAKPISDEEKNGYIEEWYKWAYSNTIYRLSDTQDGIIKAYPADFMDDSIIKTAQKKLRFLNLIDLVLDKFNHLFIPCSVIYYRILELVQEGKIKINVSLA